MRPIFFILFFTALIRPLPGQDLPLHAIQDQNGYSRFWFVFSDRENNPVYKHPGGTERKTSLHFLEQFIVAEKEGDYLHLYKDPGNVSFPGISSRATSYGWIHKDFLLLDKSSKTIALWSMKDDQEIVPEHKLYKDPAFTNSSGMQLESFSMLYVHKKVAGAVLLSRSTLLRPDPVNPETMVAGWYPSSQVEIWNNRFALEPNWEQAAYRERQANDIIPAIFSSRKAALDYHLGGKVQASSILWIDEPGTRRYGGEWKRFPILEIDDLGVCKVRVFESREQQYDAHFSHEGYTCIDILENNYPIFKVVLLLASDDLASILANFQKLVIGHGSMNTKRQHMQEVWLGLLEAQLGSLNREEFFSYSMAEISKIIFDGMPMQSDLFKYIELKDITNPSILSDVVFERYMNYLSDKISTLRIFLTERYEQSYFYEGVRYYWIPLEDFP